PREGYEFQKVGLVTGNKIEFTIGGDHFEWLSTAPVLNDGGTWNLWVLHDPKYVPLVLDYQTKKSKDPWDKLDAAVQSIKEDATRIRNQRQTTFQKNEEQERKVKPRVMVGGADRIENLW